jgi:hypothetical protein|tara:strand:+ start:116 stop:757 length:642 start_codon:yes stop_codon:yes gene_type:complete
MANIFNEVDEDIRKERYQNLWSNYGKYIIAFLMLIVIAFSLTQYFQAKNISDNKAILDMYYSAAEGIEKNQLDFANNELEIVYNQKNKMLAALSGFKMSEIYLNNNQKEEAILLLEKIVDNRSLESIYRELALYKYIMINFENIDISSIEKKIVSIGVNKNTLHPYFQEIIGIKYLTAGNIEKANSVFTDLLLNEDTPFDLKMRLDKLIQIAS